MTCIVPTMWTLEVDPYIAELMPIYPAFRNCYPHIDLIVVANMPREFELLSDAGSRRFSPITTCSSTRPSSSR